MVVNWPDDFSNGLRRPRTLEDMTGEPHVERMFGDKSEISVK